MLAAHIVGSTVGYATIQAAVNAAAAGAVINVDAGTYNETVTISKPLTIRGAQAGVDARTRSTTAAESIVYATQTVFYVGANDVTIDGFTIQGNCADIGAAQGAGVLMAPSIAGTHVLNNIIQKNVTGIYLSNNSNTDLCLIQHNLIQNNFEANNSWTKSPGENGSRGIYTDGTVSGGYLTNVLIDANKLYNSNFNGGDEDEGMIALQALTAGKQFNITITNNTIGNESKALLATNVTNLVFMGNTCSGLQDGPSGPVRFEGDANTVDVQYNTITGNAGPGVAADSSGVPGDSSGFVVNNNNIYNNDGTNKIGVIVTAAVYQGPLVAVGNWWGNTTGPSGLGSGTGSAVWGDGSTGHGVTATGKAGGGVVTFSPWATALIDITKIPVPAAATGLTASAVSASSVQLSWTPQMSTATSQLLQRSIDGVTFTTIATLPPLLSSFADTGLTASTAYTYRVVAANATGTSAPSTTAKGTTFSAAGGTVPVSGLTWVSATTGYGSVQKNLSVGGKAITLAGTPYASGLGTHAASTITYNLAGAYTTFASAVGIDAEEDGKGTGSVDFQVVGDGKVLFDSGALANDQVKQIGVSVAGVQTLQLIATNGVAGSIDYDHADWAGATLSVGSTAPAAPTGLTAKLSGTTATLTWTAGGTTQTGYTVQRTTDGVTFATVATTTAAAYADAGLTAGVTYTYRIVATNAVGSSAPSGTATVAVPAAGAITVALSGLTPTAATTGYGAVTANKTVSGNAITLGGVAYPSGVGVHAVSSLTYNLAGQYTTFTTDVGVDDEENGKGVGSVDFQIVGDGKVLFDSGVVHNGTAAAAHASVSVAGVKTLVLTATNGVAGSIDYDHADWAGATLSGTPAVPAAPTSLLATALTATSVKLAWTAAGTNVSTYAVDRSKDGTTWTTISVAVAGAATSWVDPTVLTAATAYQYRIRAVNAAGSSANSAVAAVTTKAAQTVTYLSDLTATSATSGYGTVQKDASIGGNPITLAGTTYAKGIGTHAASTIVYNLGGAYTTFVSTVGVDDEELGKGTGAVDFQVYGDGVLLFDSGVLTNGQTADLAVSVAGVKTLTLVASGVNGSIDYDHADWANAQVLA